MPQITILMVIAWIFLSVSNSFALEPLEPEFMKVTEPKFMGVTEPKFLEVSKPGFSEVSKSGFSKARSPEYLVPKQSAEGVTIWSGKRENKAYQRCAKFNGFSEQHKCALDALGISEEDLN